MQVICVFYLWPTKLSPNYCVSNTVVVLYHKYANGACFDSSGFKQRIF